MKRAILTAVVLPMLLAPLAVFAAVESGGVDSVFSYGAGLRALGMGGAFSAMKHDPALGYWNPGAMAFNQYKEFSLFGTRSIADSYYFSGFYTNPTMRVGTLSVGALGVYTGGIESYDEFGSPITGASDNYFHYQILLSYGYNFRFGLGVGATAKVEQMRITDYKGTGASFDLGAFYTLPGKLSWLSTGAVVQNVYGTGIKLVDEYEPFTRVFKLGLATNFPVGSEKKHRLTFALDTRFYNDNYNTAGNRTLLYDLSLGSEFAIAEQYMFRFGYRGFAFDSMFQGFPQGVSLGFGLRQWGLAVDYAVTFEDSDWQGPVELLMRLGVGYRFGKSIDEKKAAEEKQVQQRIAQAVAEKEAEMDAEIADLEARKAEDEERIKQNLTQAYEAEIAALEATTGTQQQEIARLGTEYSVKMKSALDEQTDLYNRQRAEIELRYTREREALNQKLTETQRRLEQEQRGKTVDLAAEKKKAELYETGLIQFADGQYKLAEQTFLELQRMDPGYLKVGEYVERSKAQQKNVGDYRPEVLELYKGGLELFIKKDYAGAIREWEKIKAIDKYNKLAERNIREAQQRLRELEALGIK